MNWEIHKKKLLKDPQLKQALEETKLEYEVARAFILTRIKNDLTQKELAKKLATQQSVISRIENARATVSLSFLKRFASSFGGQLNIGFKGI